MWQYRKAFPKPEGLQVWFAFRAIAFFLGDCFAEIMATALQFWTSAEITNNRKNSETTGFCIRYEMCVSGSFLYPARPHQQIYKQTDLCQPPAQKKKPPKTSRPNSGPSLKNNCAGKQVFFDLDGCSPGICCPPCGLLCQRRGLIWCGVRVGRSCCVKGWELLWVTLPSDCGSSGVHFHDRHLVTAKPVQSQPFLSLNCSFPLPLPKYAGL